MESTKSSLSRTLSMPRRCRICGKMIYFKSFRCRHCNHAYHRECASNSGWLYLNTETTKPEDYLNWESFRQFGLTKNMPVSSEGKNRPTMLGHHQDSSQSEAAAAQQTTGKDVKCCHQMHSSEPLGCKNESSIFSTLSSQNVEERHELPAPAPPTSTAIVAHQSCANSRSGVVDVQSNTNSAGKDMSGASLTSTAENSAGLYRKMFRWLTNRKLQQSDQVKVCNSTAIKGRSISLKHPKEKCSLEDSEKQIVMARKAGLKLILPRVVGRRLSGSFSPSEQPDQDSTDAPPAFHQLYRRPVDHLELQMSTAGTTLSRHPSPHLLELLRSQQNSCQCPQHESNATSRMLPCSESAMFSHQDSGISSVSPSVAQTPSNDVDCQENTRSFIMRHLSPTYVTTTTTTNNNNNNRRQSSSGPTTSTGTPSSTVASNSITQSCTNNCALMQKINSEITYSEQSGDNIKAQCLRSLPGLSSHCPVTAAASDNRRNKSWLVRHCNSTSPPNATLPYSSHSFYRATRRMSKSNALTVTSSGSQNCVLSSQQQRGAVDMCRGRFGTADLMRSKTSRAFSFEKQSKQQNQFCMTWPLFGREVLHENDDPEGFESGFEDYEDDSSVMCMQSPTNLKDTLGEWSIPFKDLKIGRQLRRGRHHDIHCGRWHGDVMIHIYHIKNDDETAQFWKKVSALCMIRHENLILFMGVCIDMSQLAIITSVRKGFSLYDHVHVNRDKFFLPVKVQIARQVAQGMSYLHAKGIIHRKLNSKNILLETKVKVCLLDQGMAQRDYDRNDYGCVPNGHLTYVSPEIMRSLKVRPPNVFPESPYTNESDVFAFGTVLYELFAEKWPFQGQRAHSIIWQVSKGNTQLLNSLKCPHGIKTLLTDCWMTDPLKRPNFHHILKVLQQNVLLQRRHSTSEPDSLNRLRFGKKTLH